MYTVLPKATSESIPELLNEFLCVFKWVNLLLKVTYKNIKKSKK